MCTQLQLRQILQAIARQAGKRFGGKLDAVILFGSYARGDYNEESDIDVMIRVRMNQHELKRYHMEFVHLSSELGLEYNVFISIHLQDSDTFDKYRNTLPFYQNVEKEGVCVSA